MKKYLILFSIYFIIVLTVLFGLSKVIGSLEVKDTASDKKYEDKYNEFVDFTNENKDLATKKSEENKIIADKLSIIKEQFSNLDSLNISYNINGEENASGKITYEKLNDQFINIYIERHTEKQDVTITFNNKENLIHYELDGESYTGNEKPLEVEYILSTMEYKDTLVSKLIEVSKDEAFYFTLEEDDNVLNYMDSMYITFSEDKVVSFEVKHKDQNYDDYKVSFE